MKILIDGANRSENSQVDTQLEYREIENEAHICESQQVKAEVVISNRSIFEITEMLNDIDGDTKNESADPLAASVSNHAEVIVPIESGSASVMNVPDAPTTSTRIRTPNDVQKKGIIENGSGSWVINDVPTTLPGTIVAPTEFDTNEQDVFAQANHSIENDDDMEVTSNRPGAATAIDSDANVQDVVAHANVSVGSGNATSNMLTKSAGANTSDADIEETVVTFYDSDEEPLQMSFKGTKFPAAVYSDPMPVTFVKRENDLISGDKPYEEVDVSETGFHSKWRYFSFSSFY